ncbi:MAG: hypothetical protein NTZ33_06190 [Bacteroidetes bacterium]|nr:hypothetical protein [Bacteroidota bacterium]
MYLVSLPVKPYVKRFLELNFGDPVDLKKDKKLYNYFRRCLTKPRLTYDKTRCAEISNYYNENAGIVISEDDFYRYGWELSKTDVVAFGREIEANAKFFMKNIVSFYCSHMEFSRSVRYFQEKYGFTEDIWQYDSIVKDFQRNGLKFKVEFSKEITEKIEKIILLNLSDKRTISTKMIENYANNK